MNFTSLLDARRITANYSPADYSNVNNNIVPITINYRGQLREETNDLIATIDRNLPAQRPVNEINFTSMKFDRARAIIYDYPVAGNSSNASDRNFLRKTVTNVIINR